ncbi:MAG TPA: hypothetical protein VFE34_14460 [Dongiaceae bacterium]|jgi:hypothetical protein|nr:hypothetical protein [Dongiaceae bacterium]
MSVFRRSPFLASSDAADSTWAEPALVFCDALLSATVGAFVRSDDY